MYNSPCSTIFFLRKLNNLLLSKESVICRRGVSFTRRHLQEESVIYKESVICYLLNNLLPPCIPSGWQSLIHLSSQRMTIVFSKQPCTFQKEPYVFSKEPYTFWKIHTCKASWVADPSRSCAISRPVYKRVMSHMHEPWHICMGHTWMKRVCHLHSYVVATISRLLKDIGLFCKRALQKRPIFCKETYVVREPTNRNHLISCAISRPVCKRVMSHMHESWHICMRHI